MSKKETKRKAKEVEFDEVKKTKRAKGISDDTKSQVKKKLTETAVEEVKIPADFDKDQVKIYTWNVNGIRAVLSKNELQGFFKKYDPDILSLNETKVDDETIDKLKIKKNIPAQYQQYWNCCKPPTKGYAGTAVFTKVKPLNVIYDIGVAEHDTEGRTITLEFEKFYLVIIRFIRFYRYFI